MKPIGQKLSDANTLIFIKEDRPMAIIYKIQNKKNGKIYIGQTKYSLETRLTNSFCGHFRHAFDWNSKGALYQALRKYGKDGFTYEVLESFDVYDREQLNDREQYWISYYESNNPDKGYNRTSGGSEFSRTKEQIEAIRLKQKEGWKNKKDKEEFRKHISESLKLRWQDPEFRKRQSELRKGIKRDPAIGKKIAETRRKNGSYDYTEEQRRHMSAGQIGNKNRLGKHFTEEQKQRISAGVKRAQSNPETRKKMSDAAKGRKMSEETKKKISEAVKKTKGAKKNEV